MISESDPSGLGEIACPGITLTVHMRFDSTTSEPDIETLVAELSNDEFYEDIKTKLLDLAETQIKSHFGKQPWYEVQFICPFPAWGNDDDVYIAAEGTPLRLLGLELGFQIHDSDYDHLLELLNSDGFCSHCENVAENGVRSKIESKQLLLPNLTAEVVACGGG